MQQALIQKAFKVKKVVAAYFDQHPNQTRIAAKELMPRFIAEGIWEKDHQDGLPVRDLLRKLRDEGLAKLIPQTLGEGKGENTNWFFTRTK